MPRETQLAHGDSRLHRSFRTLQNLHDTGRCRELYFSLCSFGMVKLEEAAASTELGSSGDQVGGGSSAAIPAGQSRAWSHRHWVCHTHMCSLNRADKSNYRKWFRQYSFIEERWIS